mgnify:CR=1 FL=1
MHPHSRLPCAPLVQAASYNLADAVQYASAAEMEKR